MTSVRRIFHDGLRCVVADSPPMTWRAEQICAHRGASAHYPENTAIAFDAAAHSGAGWIETDVQLLSDGELVVFHDETLGRTAAGSAPISSLSWSDVACLDIGSWKHQRFSSERPMTCTQLIQWQLDEQDRPGIIWEAKCPSDGVAATATAAALAERISAYSSASLHRIEFRSHFFAGDESVAAAATFSTHC